MNGMQILGVVLVVVGVMLLGFGYNASQSPVEELTEAFTGRFTEETMWYFIAGAASVVGGLLLVIFGRAR
jgi:drug/metabolite transporter (DMT)-like permease